MTEKIEKTGTVEELQKDLAECGFHPQKPLDVAMAEARAQIDNALQGILQGSGLPLYLFDYLVTSVLADIRKADLDTMRMAEGVKYGDTEQTGISE